MNDGWQLKQLMLARAGTVAVAESVTGGHLQSLITQISGSSEYFVGGITTYNVEQKVRHLGVDRAHAVAVNCVSEQVATEMAIGVRRLFGTTVGVGTTGYAEPWPAGNVTQPFAWIAIAIDDLIVSRCVAADGLSRVVAQDFVAREALRELVHHLQI